MGMQSKLRAFLIKTANSVCYTPANMHILEAMCASLRRSSLVGLILFSLVDYYGRLFYLVLSAVAWLLIIFHLYILLGRRCRRYLF